MTSENGGQPGQETFTLSVQVVWRRRPFRVRTVTVSRLADGFAARVTSAALTG
ncbi:hypothetical protein AB0M95_19415 [Sphaerisporangium sp. NPDC051017]|uniref:hypothetical protein n=1 Tax=Sphaerisporangium sp. NPDC051017 TaxID=3154636 RepID=UPI0034372183